MFGKEEEEEEGREGWKAVVLRWRSYSWSKGFVLGIYMLLTYVDFLFLF